MFYVEIKVPVGDIRIVVAVSVEGVSRLLWLVVWLDFVYTVIWICAKVWIRSVAVSIYIIYIRVEICIFHFIVWYHVCTVVAIILLWHIIFEIEVHIFFVFSQFSFKFV